MPKGNSCFILLFSLFWNCYIVHINSLVYRRFHCCYYCFFSLIGASQQAWINSLSRSSLVYFLRRDRKYNYTKTITYLNLLTCSYLLIISCHCFTYIIILYLYNEYRFKIPFSTFVEGILKNAILLFVASGEAQLTSIIACLVRL